MKQFNEPDHIRRSINALFNWRMDVSKRLRCCICDTTEPSVQCCSTSTETTRTISDGRLSRPKRPFVKYSCSSHPFSARRGNCVIFVAASVLRRWWWFGGGRGGGELGGWGGGEGIQGRPLLRHLCLHRRVKWALLEACLALNTNVEEVLCEQQDRRRCPARSEK